MPTSDNGCHPAELMNDGDALSYAQAIAEVDPHDNMADFIARHPGLLLETKIVELRTRFNAALETEFLLREYTAQGVEAAAAFVNEPDPVMSIAEQQFVAVRWMVGRFVGHKPFGTGDASSANLFRFIRKMYE